MQRAGLLSESLIPLNNIDIKSWTNDQIIVQVPSYVDSTTLVGGSYKKEAIGTGNVKVQDANGFTSFAISSTTANIKYSVFNYPKGSGTGYYKQNAYLISPNLDGVIHFKLNSNITEQGMKDCISAAIRRWSCHTGVNFVLDPGSVTNLDVADGVNSISINSITDGDEILAYCRHRLDRNCSTNSSTPFSTKEIDLVINQDKLSQFVYDTTGTLDIQADKTDFFEVILHEFGHAHLFNHVNDLEDVMYYQANPTPTLAPDRNLNLNSNDIDAGKFIVKGSSDSDYGITCADKYKMQALKVTCTLGTTGQYLNSINDLLIYPNPFSSDFTIELESNRNEEYNIEIFNSIGDIVHSSKGNITNGFNQIRINIENAENNVLLVSLKTASGRIVKKILCIK